MIERNLSQLNDLEDIAQLKARYCRLIDQKKWRELEDAFLPGAFIEIAGAPGGPDDTRTFRDAHSFIEGLRHLMDPLMSVHQVHAPEIALLDRTHARGTWAVSDRLVFPQGGPLRILQGWGIYHERYEKVDEAWRFAEIHLERLLVEPTPSELA
ncbi:nuclear transport factor 2 family protein [Aeromicrobium sp. CF4.19]|uniref:nuclear transport factor 2 family protein n=1 Tax=Aeromicrobium sp. CF4.19 TaxID=3373082 RepID=UPI003EE7A787